MPHRVLFIENDAAMRQRFRRLLEESGIAVEESATGLEGLERARTLPYDLVLADTRLPDIEGLEVAARLKQDRALARVPFVAVGREPEHDVALAAGWDGFIGEPLEDARFVEEVKSYLSGKRESGKRERLPSEGERGGLGALATSLAPPIEETLGGEARAQLADADRRRSAFMRDLAHELSTPITPLAGYLKILLSEKLGPLLPQQRKVAEGMLAAVKKLTRIVDNLSDFASLQVGQAVIVSSAIDPDALAEEVVNELRVAVRDARIHVDVRPSRAGPVMADARKLRQALANLVSNAVKFSPHGGAVLVDVSREGDKLRFAVYDQGPGVPGPEAERIFEPFQHAAREGDARLPGSGLGLPVARRIAEAHGGRLRVESPPHTQPSAGAHHYPGSKFVLEIPAIQAAMQGDPPARVSG